MAKPMISVAGIRGTLGGSLVPEEFLKYAAAFCSTLENRTVVLGGDTRPSGPMVRHLALGACLATGCRVFDLGVCPTPTVGLMARHLGTGGGIAVTASHNPLDWNALKFFSGEGLFLPESRVQRVLERYEAADFDYVTHERIGDVEPVEAPCAPHLAAVLGAVDVEAVRAAGIRTAIDLCNGAGITLLSDLLDALGCRAERVFDDPARAFERVAEPLAENLSVLRDRTAASGAQVGFAVDPDADRLALVDETGRAIGEERTLTLCAWWVLKTRGVKGATGPLAANLSTTRALDDVAAMFDTRVERTRIGEAHVAARILETGALIGGEGNGGIIFPQVHPGRDAATGIALVLEMLATTGQPLSELNAVVPDYAMAKEKVSVEGKSLDRVFKALRTEFTDAETLDETDGLKFVYADRWVHVRASGTEPVVRVFSEAPDEQGAAALAARGLRAVNA